MITPNIKEKCCGCGACESICSVSAIEMRVDEEGFAYPYIHADKCVHCDRCEQVCPCFGSGIPEKELQKAYAGRTRSDEVLMSSTSGGVAFELARHAIESGGIAVGACFDEAFGVHHQLIETVEELHKTQGSKYVQSDTVGVYRKVKSVLEKGSLVYFSGTPCQIEGLLGYLGKDYDNLITQDLICHGVPSPGLWEDYLEKTGFHQAESIRFRDKRDGWETNCAFAVSVDGKEKRWSFDNNPFTYFFNYNYSLRPICYACPFKTGVKRSDLTVADLWGISKILPDYTGDDKGMSLMIVHSEKGQRYFESVSDRVESVSVDFDTAVHENMAYYISMKHPPQRDEFMHAVWEKGWNWCYRRFKPRDPFILAVKKKLYPLKERFTGRG